ncbi:MAG: MarR family transcriptional regulator [Dehalococcoidia bacterium]
MIDTIEVGETLFALLGRTWYEVIEEAEQCVGLSQARLSMLLVLHREGELSQADLQRRLGVDAAAISRQVRQLNGEGLVNRRPDPIDTRCIRVALSDHGRAQLRRLEPARTAFFKTVLAGLDPSDLQALIDGLTRIRRNIALKTPV